MRTTKIFRETHVGTTHAPVHRAGISKKLNPGQPGTKRYQRQFGDALVCVRYRTHPETAKRYASVEIIVDERQTPGLIAPKGMDEDTVVAIAIAYNETDLRQRAKQAGAHWDQVRKVWLMPYRAATQLGLHGRIKKIGGAAAQIASFAHGKP